MLLASGPGTRSTVYEGYAGYVTTWVSPHEGHMTSIGRRLVDRSIGLPQRRQVIDMGDVGGVWTGPSGGGGGAPFAPPRAGAPPPPPPHPITPIRRRGDKKPGAMAENGAAPTAGGQKPVPQPPAPAGWDALAPGL